jgi:hypothetical protein
VGARVQSGSNYAYETIRSQHTGDTDITSLDWEATTYQIVDNQSDSNVYGNLMDLGSGSRRLK